MEDPLFLRRLTDQNGPTARSRELADGTYIMAKPLLFHWTLIRGEIGNTMEYFDRWCYSDRPSAMDALRRFPNSPASDYEPDGWHRHPKTGRRRIDSDRAREYVAP